MRRIDEILKGMTPDSAPRGTGDTRPTERSDEDVCPICGGTGLLLPDLPVDHPDFGHAVPCQCALRKLEERRQEHLRKWSDLGALSHMTFENFTPGGRQHTPAQQRNLQMAYERARAFAENPQGWLVFRGGFGSGKTHLAAAIANYRLALGEAVVFAVVPDLLDYLRASFSPTSEAPFDERFQSILDTPLLVLDDLGTQSSTPWAQEKLFQILNHRYNRRQPTVITMNCELDEIDLRLRSRLLDLDLVEHVVLQVPDYRGAEPGGIAELDALALYTEMTFERFDLRQNEQGLTAEQRENLREAFAFAKQYAQSPDGWVVFQGVYGCGKTHLAAAIANYRHAQGEPVVFVVVPDLLDHLRATFSPLSPVSYDRRLEEVKMAKFLVLDDLGTESATPWAREKLYQICNYRYLARLPTVFTTSQDMDKLDPRLRIRMLDKTRCTVVQIKAPAYRGQARSDSPGRPRSRTRP
ncbi:MAG: ATP-binding protein [Chloroflexi bacterium]|nr:ATP-binding protein [Chloroflexota bacterium]